jgi:hydrogenase maturation protease
MKNQQVKILVYGIGNPGRQDDGIGIAFAEEIEKWIVEKKYLNIEVTQNYQLNIEDAEKISHFTMVIFADASIETDAPFKYEIVKPSAVIDFTMHSVVPSFVLGLCQTLFSSNVSVYQIHIKGEQWEFMKPFSEKANENVALAIKFVQKELEDFLVLEN